MAKFIVRIGIHGSQPKSFYEKIKNAMATEGFKNEARISNKLLQLPIGEFYIDSEFTLNQILERAKKIASDFNKDCCILVSEINALDGYNLLPNFEVKVFR